MKALKIWRIAFAMLAAVVSLGAEAQTELEGQGMSKVGNDVSTAKIDQPLLVDSQHIATDASFPQWQKPEFRELPSSNSRIADFTMPTMNTVEPFRLWKGAGITAYGTTAQMPGLMDAATGMVSLHQDFGRLHLTGSTIANKYWMPMQSQLYTQYGFGGTIGYDLSDAVSLHAFGYYYAHNPLVGPAFIPYVSTTSYGGYADIHFSDRFGSNIGVRRYINPMSGQWTTSPIVTPYFRVGKRNKVEIGLPLGELLKAAVWGDRDNPMRFRPQPQPQPKKK